MARDRSDLPDRTAREFVHAARMRAIIVAIVLGVVVAIGAISAVKSCQRVETLRSGFVVERQAQLNAAATSLYRSRFDTDGDRAADLRAYRLHTATARKLSLTPAGACTVWNSEF